MKEKQKEKYDLSLLNDSQVKHYYRHIDAEILALLNQVYPIPQQWIKPSSFEGYYLLRFKKDYQFDFITRGISNPNRLSGINVNALKKLSLDDLPPNNEFRYSKGTLLKPGKFLRALFGDIEEINFVRLAERLAEKLVGFNEDEIIVTNYPSEYYSVNTDYDLNSCMQGQPANFFELYDILDNCGLVVILEDDSEKESILARALLWNDLKLVNYDGKVIKENVIFLDRIYSVDSDCERKLINYAKHYKFYYRVGTKIYQPNGELLDDNYIFLLELPEDLKKGSLSGCPYVDTLCYVLEKDFKLYLASDKIKGFIYRGSLQNTDGTGYFVEDYAMCEICGEYYPETEITYISNLNIQVCSYCLEEHIAFCDFCENPCLIHDSIICEDKIFCSENCANSLYYFACYHCGNYYPMEELTKIGNDNSSSIRYYCPICREEFTCDDCGNIQLEITKVYLDLERFKQLCDNCKDKYQTIYDGNLRKWFIDEKAFKKAYDQLIDNLLQRSEDILTFADSNPGLIKLFTRFGIDFNELKHALFDRLIKFLMFISDNKNIPPLDFTYQRFFRGNVLHPTQIFLSIVLTIRDQIVYNKRIDLLNQLVKELGLTIHFERFNPPKESELFFFLD